MDNLQELDLDPVEFDELADLFVELKVFSSPSELHGLLCGQLARGENFDENSWLKGAATFLEQERFESDESKTLLLEMYVTTLQQFMADGFELLMLLPEDDSTIYERAESLGRWCQGFVTGFGVARTRVSEEARETVEDLEQIIQIDDEGIEADEDSEQNLMQLVEYVRMAAIMLYSEVHAPSQPGSDSTPSLH
jgi:uncharacterized protein